MYLMYGFKSHKTIIYNYIEPLSHSAVSGDLTMCHAPI